MRLCVYVYTARLVRTDGITHPSSKWTHFLKLPTTLTRHNFHVTGGSASGSGRGDSLRREHTESGRDFNSGLPAPLRPRDTVHHLPPLPGGRAASPCRPAGTRNLHPLSRSSLSAATSGQAGEAVSLTCPPSAAPRSPPFRQPSNPGPDAAGSRFFLRHRPPALPDHMTQAGRGLGRRFRRAKLRGATSALCTGSAHSVPAARAGPGCCCRLGDKRGDLRRAPSGTRWRRFSPAGERSAAGHQSLGSWPATLF